MWNVWHYPVSNGVFGEFIPEAEKEREGEMRKGMIQKMRKGIACLMTAAMLMGSVAVDSLALTARAQASIVVTKQRGYEEGAYVEWEPVEGADGYIVYTSTDSTVWQEIDDELIRSYGSYMRADALGLTAGTWQIKIEAATFDSNRQKTGTVTEQIVTVEVTAHDRSGYAWADGGTASGAYNEDGTLKENANVVYVTEATKDTVSLEVAGASSNPCVGVQEILNGYKKKKETKPLAIRIIGNVTDPTVTDKGDLVIDSNAGPITIEGVGEDAVANGWGLRLKNAVDVEVRNLAFMNCDSSEGDNVGLQQNNRHVWVHHNDFFYGQAGSDADQVKGDGMLDCKKSDWITMSYNHFWDSGKSCLLGLEENDNDLHVTYHHNWFDHSDSRHPRIRFFTTHVYNNYYDGNAKYGVGAAKGGASVFVENNYYRNCPYPMLISMQGSDLWDEAKQQNVAANGTFSSEDGSIIKAYGNLINGQEATGSVIDENSRFIAYLAEDDPDTPWDESVEFDAYVASSRDEKVPETVKTVQGEHTYNNFDTAEDFYEYTPDPARDVPEIVKAHAGRVDGGDLQWTFDNAKDDTSYALNQGLKDAVTGYTSKLVSVGGILGASVKIYYTVTFDPGNGEAVTEQQVEANHPVPRPADPQTLPEGKVSFDGWYNGSTKWDFSKGVTGDMTLVGKWLAEGESSGGGEGGSGEEGGTGGTPIGTETIIHDFTKSGKSSKYFAISGNMKSSVGTSGTYENTTYQGNGLKLETATQITFTTTTAAKLVLVLESGFAGKVKVDGQSLTAAAGVLETDIEAGSHSIAKGGSTQLYAIYVIPDGSQPAPSVEYTITVDKGDGSGTVQFKVKEGEQITLKELPTPVRDGYTFLRWENEAGEEIVLPYTPVGDMTIKAVWQQNSTEDPVDPGDQDTPEEGLHVELRDPGEEYVYTGSAVKPAILVTNNGVELTEGTDYTVKYSGNVKASTTKNKAKITVTGKGNLTGSASTTFEILPKDINDEDVEEGTITVVKNTKPAPVLVYNNMKLGSKDYTVKDNRKFTEDGQITVTGKGNYTGERTLDVTVKTTKKEVKKFTVTLQNVKLTYNGEEQKIPFTVKDSASKEVLTEGEDYLVLYPENVTDAGSRKFTVVGTGDYTGSVTKSYTIRPLAAAAGSMTAEGVDEEGYEYVRTGVTVGEDLVVRCTADGAAAELTEGRDYKISYTNNRKAGTAKYTVVFQGNYKGTKALTGSFRILPATLEEAQVSSADKVYSGKKGTYVSKPVVTIGDVALGSGDYTVKYYKDAAMEQEITGKNKLELGAEENEATVYVKVSGKGNYAKEGSVATGEYRVVRRSSAQYDLSKARVTVLDAQGKKTTKVEYTGEKLEPAVKVEYKIKGKYETVGEENYSVEYVNNVNKGRASIILTAEGEQYVGGKTVTFNIVAKNVRKVTDLFKDLFARLEN